uniref:hypothetical protein n=1 Tax=Pseudanabaena sp. 'Roaring Creek' TaxID=1681830 RepID=UPI000AD472B9
PSWVGQRFEPPSLDKSVFSLPPLQSTNLIKYTLGGLGTLSFGVAMAGALLTKPLFWDSDIKIEYDSQIFDIPSHKFVNNEKYAFIYLNYSCSCELGFLRSI